MALVTRGVGVEPGALIERAEQMAELQERWREVREHGEGRLVLISGEAGVGKTALVRSHCDSMDRLARVLWAGCEPAFTPRPLGPLLDIARVTGGNLKERLDAGAQAHDVAGALMDELQSPLATVLVLEDMHWADEATLDVARLLARRAQTLPVMLLYTYREEELGRFHRLRVTLGELAGTGGISRVDVKPLSREGVAQLAETGEVDADSLFQRTAGNPFFVTEALAAGSDRVPPTVRDAVLARASRLSPAARELLDAAAVLPARAAPALLDAIAPSPQGTLEECVGSGMLSFHDSGVAFRHELARLVVEESLAPDRRQSLHALVLAATEGQSFGPPDLAHLAYHAEGARDAKAVLKFARAAAEEAAALGAHTEAQAQYGRALRFAGDLDPSARADLLEQFAEEGHLTDGREAAVEAIEEATSIYRVLGDIAGLGRALHRSSCLLSSVGRPTAAMERGTEAVQVLEQGAPGHELAMAYSGLAGLLMVEDRLAEATSWGQRALALAEQLDDVEALVDTLNNLGCAELGKGDLSGAENLMRSLELALEADLATAAARAYNNLTFSLMRVKEWEQAEPLIEAGLVYVRSRGLDAWVNSLLCNRAMLLLAEGSWDEAADVAALLIRESPPTKPGPRMVATRVLGLVRARRGDPGAWPMLDESQELASSVGELQYLAPIATARAEARWLEGDSEAALKETEAALALSLDREVAPTSADIACWRLRAGASVDCPAGALEPQRLQLTGHHEEAARLLREKKDVYEAALALADSGSRSAWRQALDDLNRLGARPAAATVARRLREAGERGLPRGPRPQTRENPLGLTARQLEVLELLVTGMRNAEIADRLVVAPKTVDHHVSAILTKLDVSSRGEAAAKAMQLGLSREL